MDFEQESPDEDEFQRGLHEEIREMMLSSGLEGLQDDVP